MRWIDKTHYFCFCGCTFEVAEGENAFTCPRCKKNYAFRGYY